MSYIEVVEKNPVRLNVLLSVLLCIAVGEGGVYDAVQTGVEGERTMGCIKGFSTSCLRLQMSHNLDKWANGIR